MGTGNHGDFWSERDELRVDTQLGLGSAGDAGVPAVSRDTGPTASRSWNLHLCEQDYHKLLEFFFSGSVPPELGHLLWRSVQPVKVVPDGSAV